MRNYSGRNPFTLDHIGLFSLNFSFLTLHCSVVLRFCPGNLVFACQLEGAIGEFCYHWGYLKNISQKENWETQGKGNLKKTFPSHQPKFLNRANTVLANGNGSAIWRKKWCFLETILTKQKQPHSLSSIHLSAQDYRSHSTVLPSRPWIRGQELVFRAIPTSVFTCPVRSHLLPPPLFRDRFCP